MREQVADVPVDALEAVLLAAAKYGEPEEGYVDRFEAVLADWWGVAHAVVCSSNTGAVSVLAGTLGLEPGDELVLSPNAPYWVVSALMHSGVRLVFVDYLSDRFALDVEGVKASLNARTRGVLVTPAFGYPEDMQSLKAMTQTAGVPLVVDATRVWGQSSGYRALYQCADIGLVSFTDGESLLSTGEGGALFFPKKTYAFKAKSYTRFSDLDGLHLGINQKLSEVQAALGAFRLAELSPVLKDRQHRLQAMADRLHAVGIPCVDMGGTEPYGAAIVVRCDDLNTPLRDVCALEIALDLPLFKNESSRCQHARALAKEWCSIGPDAWESSTCLPR